MQTYHLNRRPLFILGEFNSPTSYCFLARMLVTALMRNNMRVAIDSRCNLGPQCSDWMRRLEAISTRDDWKLWIYPVCQLHETAEYLNPSHPLTVDKKTILYTMWEAAYLRPEWVETLNRAAMVLVPCEWNRMTFMGSGVTSPIRVVPLGCDVETYRPCEPDRDCRDFPPCTFGTAGALTGGGWRKNLEFVADAFQYAFPTESDVRLQIKVTPYCVRYLNKNPETKALEWIDSRLKLADDHLIDPRIEVIPQFLEDAAMARWYRGLDAFVNASSGEGFGLHLLEAMACGVPLISTDYSGQSEFFDQLDGKWITGYPATYRLCPIPANDIYQGVWIKPDLESFAAQMRAVYDNRAEARRRGLEAAKVASMFSWDSTGERLKWLLRQKVA